MIHGGDRTIQEERFNWRVPKRDLVATLQVLLLRKRLKVASKLELGPVLNQEMLNFRVKIDPTTAHDSYSAWRERDHDDLVLAVALGCWWGEKGPKKKYHITGTAPVIGGGNPPPGIEANYSTEVAQARQNMIDSYDRRF